MSKYFQGLGPTLGWTAKLSKACMDARVSQYDVTPAQTHVLLYLQQHGGRVPQNELADYPQVKPSVLDRMVEKGLVCRSVSGSDARRRLIHLTEKGAEQQALLQRSFLDVEEAMTRGFSPEEREVLLAFLNRVIQNLKEDSET